jgi:EAL and modified HD-GYP domain-containing signal transduction protein
MFVNFPKQLLLEEMYTVLPREQAVIELLESTAVDDEVIATCKKLKAAGYVLALDDVTDPIAIRPLLPYADIVKIDFMGLAEDRRKLIAAELSGHPGKLLAEKIESRSDFDQAMELGCEYVQGYFFAKPEIMAGKGVAGNRGIYLQFIRALNQPVLDFDLLEELIKRDVSLSYKLLRYLNSAAIGLRNKITSIRQALVLMGERPLRKWGSLVALTNLNQRKPAELILMCLVRANFCERIAKVENLPDRQLDMFLVGLLSAIDAVLDMSMEQVLAQMSIIGDVSAVLLNQPTAPKDLLQIYKLTLACERGAWGTVTHDVAGLHLTQSEMAMMWYEAITWADEVLRI